MLRNEINLFYRCEELGSTVGEKAAAVGALGWGLVCFAVLLDVDAEGSEGVLGGLG